MKTHLTLEVSGMPEVLAAIRKEFADMLRERAKHEEIPHTARTLIELAAAFEAGQKS